MRGRAASLVLAAGLLVLGLALSFALQPRQLSEIAASTTTTTEPPLTGLIEVAVSVQGPGGTFLPDAGANVAISSVAFPELKASFQTNGTGMVLFSAAPGRYGVAVSEARFSAAAAAAVSADTTAVVRVTVNRTGYLVGFADAAVLGGTGVVEPWGHITVTISGVSGGGNVRELPPTVFIDSYVCCYFPGPTQAAEVEATVVSQAARGGDYFVDLQPQAPLNLTEALGLALVTYQAGTKVTTAVGLVG